MAAVGLMAAGTLSAKAQTSAALTEAPAATPAAPSAPAAEAPPTGLWISGIHLSAQIDAGFMGNPFRPADGLNFGHLFTDHANQLQLNQVLLTAQKPLDPKNPDFQWGFKVQFMYGSDARYTQFLGELNRVDPNARYQFDIVEANVQAHLPWLTEGGVDLKAGQYPTPVGYETIDPSTNLFYSYFYIFQFGLPSKHTGANTTWGPLGENNGAIGGIGLNLMDGNLRILALTHFGPEEATRLLSPLGVDANGQRRYFTDVIVTWKTSDALTLVTEGNLVRDGYGAAGRSVNGFGVAQYASYALTETVALNGRVEY
jgi:Putative beta-barrel porin-2, OmpL-like. bbp2